ncbi:nucleotide exchange factor GrpE [Nitrospina gracilis]|uniref:nucleotide exchange factor GrpE n=1 Tax=Nitrospina gracilis TaxID=35801 RepID=UPI001F43D525|nr:nucleotide exchange factor GrpE [Nitrospina gracilis]MCF8720951.1 molecular chaperone GrpE [Nitrospina gracilis Nb-211]
MNDSTSKLPDFSDQPPPKFNVTDRRHWALEEDAVEEEESRKERLPTYVEQLRQEAEEKDKRLKEYIAAYKNKNAENDEFRQRLQKENEGRLAQLKAGLFKQLIPIVDNLKRASSAAQSTGDFESFKQGIHLILSQFEHELTQQGIEPIPAVGRKLDPNTDEVCMTVDTEDPAQDGIVVEELEPGYRFQDKLLKPVKVKVAKLKN